MKENETILKDKIAQFPFISILFIYLLNSNENSLLVDLFFVITFRLSTVNK